MMNAFLMYYINANLVFTMCIPFPKTFDDRYTFVCPIHSLYTIYHNQNSLNRTHSMVNWVKFCVLFSHFYSFSVMFSWNRSIRLVLKVIVHHFIYALIITVWKDTKSVLFCRMLFLLRNFLTVTEIRLSYAEVHLKVWPLQIR